MKTLGVGVIGYGFMGRTHTFAHKSIPFYYQPEPVPCQLKVVCEATDELARAAREEGGFKRCTTDMMDVIKAGDVDIVHISTPNQLHFRALSAALEAGKHIYIDKPVTANLQEADQIATVLAQYQGTAQVVFQYRFFPATLRAKELVDEGFLGPITHFRAAYLHSGSVEPNKPLAVASSGTWAHTFWTCSRGSSAPFKRSTVPAASGLPSVPAWMSQAS